VPTNPCFDYNTYRERVRERERNDAVELESERICIRNRALVDNNLDYLQHSCILIPPSVESDQNVLQDNTVSSTTDDIERVNFNLFAFFRSLLQ